MPKLHKRVTIARSGVYNYSPERLSGLGLSLPPERKSQTTFRVYRSPEVVARNKDKFVQLPLTLLHPPVFVDGNSFRDYVVGYTGDTVEARTEKNVVYLDSTVTIFDNEALNAYWRGIREVSPGYRGVFAWQDGVTPDGEPYDIIMTDIVEANHLALVKEGKGGSSVLVLDAKEVLVSRKRSGLFYAIRKRLGGVQDDIKGNFEAQLNYLAENRSKLSEEDIGKRVGRLQEDIDYFPESRSKEQLNAFVQDLVNINQESDESVKVAVTLIGRLHTKLDKSTTEALAMVLDEEDFKEEKKKPEKPSEGEGQPPVTEAKEGESAKPEEADKAADGEKPPEGIEAAAAPAPEPATPSAMDQPHAGLDDSIFDKKENELTEEECEYIHGLVMEMVKQYIISKLPVPEPAAGHQMQAGGQMPAGAGMAGSGQQEAGPGAAGGMPAAGAPPEGAPGHEASETSEEEKKEGIEKPEEEKRESEETKKNGEKSKVEDSVDRLMPPMPLKKPTTSEGGIDTDAFFRKLKGVK